MTKRLAAKLTVTIAALGALALLPGCTKEVDSSVVSAAWGPIGYSAPQPPAFGPSTGAAGGSTATASTSGN
jgi:hypothetical protein